MTKPVVTPEDAARQIHTQPGRSAILFGPERSGLETEDVALARAILTVPINPEFGSLNLAQAVILVAYEWSKGEALVSPTVEEKLPPAPQDELDGMIAQLQDARDAIDDPKLWPPPATPRNLAEGYRYVLGFLYGSISRCLGPTPEFPYFVRAIQPLNRSTIDNCDALYLMAPIDGNYSYTIRGRAGDTSAWRGGKAPAGVRKAPHYVIFEAPSGYSGESGSLKELKPGSRILSHQFEMPGVKPDRTWVVESTEDGDKHRIFLWRFVGKRLRCRRRRHTQLPVVEHGSGFDGVLGWHLSIQCL